MLLPLLRREKPGNAVQVQYRRFPAVLPRPEFQWRGAWALRSPTRAVTADEGKIRATDARGRIHRLKSNYLWAACSPAKLTSRLSSPVASLGSAERRRHRVASPPP